MSTTNLLLPLIFSTLASTITKKVMRISVIPERIGMANLPLNAQVGKT